MSDLLQRRIDDAQKSFRMWCCVQLHAHAGGVHGKHSGCADRRCADHSGSQLAQGICARGGVANRWREAVNAPADAGAATRHRCLRAAAGVLRSPGHLAGRGRRVYPHGGGWWRERPGHRFAPGRDATVHERLVSVAIARRRRRRRWPVVGHCERRRHVHHQHAQRGVNER